MRFRFVALLCVYSIYGEVPAKLHADRAVAYADVIPLRTIRPLPGARIHDLEARIRPFLESKLRGGIAIRPVAEAIPRETDFLLLAREWDRLSPEFKAFYETATRIPDTFAMHVSPGSRFEVYYTVGDPANGVDAVDTAGYGARGDWRVRINGPNGIPDYVDETAWALDSAWSMLIDRFAFLPPVPYSDGKDASHRYRVVITGLGPGDYGLTFPKGKANGAAKGYSSYMEIRNSWRGDEWRKLEYDIHPENGIRVTCAHELFHAVQYAMISSAPHDVDLDDFPLTWLEGTAVLMEELAFDSVNDYLQYTEAFFANPGMSFFDGSEGTAAYANSLLAKYLFEKATGAPRIDFIRRIFFANYTETTPFHPNLRTTSLAFGTAWVAILNRFFTAGYFSGSRADTSRFLGDSRLLGEWNFSRDTIFPPSPRTASVNPYAMHVFDIEPGEGQGDTLFFALACEGRTPEDTLPHSSWAASCILTGAMGVDSIFVLPLDNTDRAVCRIDGWKSRRELLLFVTNGHPTEKRNVTIYDLTPTLLTVFPNPTRLGSGGFVRFAGKDIREIRIYSMDGRLVCSSADHRTGAIRGYCHGYEWRLTNNAGAAVVPGYYSALIVRNDAPGNAKKTELHKVLVYP